MKKIKNIILGATSICLLGFALPLITLAASPAVVNLGSAGNFAILAKSGISTTGSTSITGDIGVSPIAATSITGFGLTLNSSNAYSTSPIVIGKIYAADYSAPTPTTLSTAISDMQTAYVEAAGRTNPTATELGAGNIGGMTLASGVYKWSTGVIVPTNVTLSGSATDVWIFQIAQTLTVSSGVRIVLSGGAQASNIFWVVAGQTTLGTSAVFNGNILDQTAIVLNTGATLNGSALAQTAVTLDANVVTKATASVVPPPTPTPTPTPTPVPTPTPAPTPASTPTPTPAPVLSVTPVASTVTSPTSNQNVASSVTVPSLPNTGFSPEKSNSVWNFIIPAGVLIFLLSLFARSRKQA